MLRSRYWKYDWMDTYIKVDSITASGVYTQNNATPPHSPFTPGSRFYAVDSLAFLDAPGEYLLWPTTQYSES